MGRNRLSSGISKIDRISSRITRLTEREREVFFLVAKRYLNKQVAAELGIKVRTVKTHRHKVMEKMEARSI